MKYKAVHCYEIGTGYYFKLRNYLLLRFALVTGRFLQMLILTFVVKCKVSNLFDLKGSEGESINVGYRDNHNLNWVGNYVINFFLFFLLNLALRIRAHVSLNVKVDNFFKMFNKIKYNLKVLYNFINKKLYLFFQFTNLRYYSQI